MKYERLFEYILSIRYKIRQKNYRVPRRFSAGTFLQSFYGEEVLTTLT